ncbi:unnamed protein product [Effrenium voratum]|nr:unnamed protein product [Effrenium voratum]
MRAAGAAKTWSKFSRSRSTSANEEDKSDKSPRDKSSKWKFTERSRSPTEDRSSSRSSSQRRSTLLDAAPEAGSALQSTPRRRSSDALAQYFQAKRERPEEPGRSVPRFGAEDGQESLEASTAASALKKLEAELITLKLTDLKIRAEVWGCESTALDRAQEQASPRAAVATLILDSARKSAGELSFLKPSELRKRAEAAGLGRRQIAEAEDSRNPRAAFVSLLLTHRSPSEPGSPWLETRSEDAKSAVEESPFSKAVSVEDGRPSPRL